MTTCVPSLIRCLRPPPDFPLLNCCANPGPYAQVKKARYQKDGFDLDLTYVNGAFVPAALPLCDCLLLSPNPPCLTDKPPSSPPHAKGSLYGPLRWPKEFQCHECHTWVPW